MAKRTDSCRFMPLQLTFTGSTEVGALVSAAAAVSAHHTDRTRI